jgi:hypothetical protein
MLGNEEVFDPLMEAEQAEKDRSRRRNLSNKCESEDPVGAVTSRITKSICQRQNLITDIQKKFGYQNLIARNGFMRRNSSDR